jgi:hypothetical protein
MSLTVGGIASANDYGWLVIDPRANTATQAITQGFPTGELWGINSQVFSLIAMQRTLASKEEPAVAFGVISAEKIYARSLENYVAGVTQELKLKPPFVVELGIVGLKGLYMGAPHPEFSSGFYYGPIRESSLVRRYELRDDRIETQQDRLRLFFDEIYDLAECSRSEVLTDEHVRINGIPPRTKDR